MSAFQLHPTRWLAIIGAMVTFFMVLSGTVRYTSGDSRYSLLASQAILEHGTWRLDGFADELPLTELNHGKNWMLYVHPETHHRYYDYPVGTSVFSLPFVAVARACGMLPASVWQESDLQMLIASTLLAVIFLLLFRLAKLYIDDWAALAFAGLMVFGTSVASSLGTALWSSDFETLFILAALLEIAEFAKGKREKIRGGRLGFLLFAAYLCRPTAMFFILVVFGYLALKQRRALWISMAVSGAFMLWFVIWSLLEMKTFLPRYYTPGNWKPYGEYLHNLWPILFGPARGIFSFTPALAIGLVGWLFVKQRKDPLFIGMWVWFALHTWMVLRSKNPWGGWCYGPRFYAEVIPGLALTLLMTFESLADVKERIRNWVGGTFLVFSCFGLFVHTWQGLYSPIAGGWNDHPNVDIAWANVRWDWRYPQFLATGAMLDVRKHENDMAGEVSELLDSIPKESALLYGFPDPGMREIFRYWNRRDVLHKGKPVFNSIAAISKAGFREFWFKTDLLDFLRHDYRVRIDPPIADSILGPDSVMVAAQLPRLGHAVLTIEPPQK